MYSHILDYSFLILNKCFVLTFLVSCWLVRRQIMLRMCIALSVSHLWFTFPITAWIRLTTNPPAFSHTNCIMKRLGTRVDIESRFAIFLARIMWKMSVGSRENISASLASLTSLARRKKCDILSSFESRNLRDSQTSKIWSRVKISNDSCESRYEISVCETRESCYKICLRVLLRNLFLRYS